MKKLMIEFDMDNEAFADGNDYYEVERILDNISEQFQEGKESNTIIDINGNVIGRWQTCIKGYKMI